MPDVKRYTLGYDPETKKMDLIEFDPMDLPGGRTHCPGYVTAKDYEALEAVLATVRDERDRAVEMNVENAHSLRLRYDYIELLRREACAGRGSLRAAVKAGAEALDLLAVIGLGITPERAQFVVDGQDSLWGLSYEAGATDEERRIEAVMDEAVDGLCWETHVRALRAARDALNAAGLFPVHLDLADASEALAGAEAAGDVHRHTCTDEKNGGGDGECIACGERDCPHSESLHHHHDGCPACHFDEKACGAKL